MTAMPPAHRATFVTGRPVTTEVIVRRGLLRDPVTALAQPPERRRSPLVVCTDRTVGALYAHRFVERLRATGQTVHLLVMPDGEAAKTLTHYQRLVTAILDRDIDEQTELVALGGGVVCNVTGMLAATLYRGLGLVHVPTTLMAQADAAIGHKQALNGEHRWLKAMEIKASNRKGVDPAIELIVGQAGQQPVIASLLPAHGSLLQRKGQGQGGLLPHQPRHDLRIRLPANGQLQRAQDHRFWRQQRASTWSLDTALEQQITNQIAQGFGE